MDLLHDTLAKGAHFGYEIAFLLKSVLGAWLRITYFQYKSKAYLAQTYISISTIITAMMH